MCGMAGGDASGATEQRPATAGEFELAEAGGDSLPLLPGFREMALRRMSQERSRLVADLVARRQAAGLSQTEIAARMRTSQSAVARLEAGGTDVRVSTLERYTAAVGDCLCWQVQSANPTAETP